MPYRVVVAGSSEWYCPALAREVIARLVAMHGPIEVIQGGAEGVDRAFAEAAFDAGQGVRLYQAEWEVPGESEGADLCVAVHRDLAWSGGTAECVRQALAAGIRCVVVDSEACEPRRVRDLPRPRVVEDDSR